MTAGYDVERRLAADLQRELDAAVGPHPTWAGSPAAARIATSRGGIRRPGRLLAIAAVLAIAGGVALLAGLRRDATGGGCPTLADYAAASARPTPVEGTAPGVTFPLVAPTATMTTGHLRPGDWAVIANAEGPGLQIRVRDVRECGRLPDLRSNLPDGSLYLATVDVRVLRDDTGLAWLGVRSLLGGGVGATPGVIQSVLGFDVPGVDDRTNLRPPEGFAVTSTLILDVPRTDKRITVDHPTENTSTLPGLEPTQPDWPRVQWIIRDGDPTGGQYVPEPLAVPGATATTGEVVLGQDITVVTRVETGVLRFRGLDSVVAYPGLLPAPGHVFIEVLVEVLDRGKFDTRWNDWHAVGPDGAELTIVHEPYGTNLRPAVLPGLISEEAGNGGWIVVEAPERGPVRLEYREYGSADALFWLPLRD
jgi:hypothetical protein